jgi:hypothetical protein
MRLVRTLAIASVLAGMCVVSTAAPATADGGGAYLNFDRTHYLPGQTAVGRTSVAIPLGKRSVLDDGPFYAYLVTGTRWPAVGGALPNDVLQIGTFVFHHRTGARFDLIARLSIPDVRGDFYWVSLCNDPCTVNGFSQPVMGYLSIVQTVREAKLLNEIQHRNARIGDLLHEARTDKKDLSRMSSTLTAVERDDRLTNAKVGRLTEALTAARARRPLLDTPVIATAGFLLLLAIAVPLLGRRRRSTRPTLETELRTITLGTRDEERVG